MAAATILIPVAKQLLGKAADLALEQLGLLWNFRRELRKLKDTVSRIQAVLLDAEEKQFHNHQVKDWLEKLSDVMYDADDMLDDLATEARRKAILKAADDTGGRTTTTTAANCWSLVCFMFSSLPKQLAYDLKMAHAIKAIREKLDDISKDKETLQLEVRAEEAPPLKETDSCPPTIVIGREDDKKNIIQLLLNSNCEANIAVVPIVGMGGLGKTTLAQLIFDDDQVRAHFDIKAWVYVSQSFDVKVILEKILRSIDRHSRAGPELDDLQAQLREEIKGRGFLFVLDDVWEETMESWETLGKYLMAGAPNSKVLVTTRSTKVAEVGGRTLKSGTSTGIVVPYLLEGLSPEASWDLLVKKALNGKAPRNPVVEITGRKILERCHGVPLAISTISGLLSSKNPDYEWHLFLESELKKKKKNNSKEENAIVSTLKLSFDHLPSHMKKCFTYCKVFPKGYKFDVPMLVHLWIAQGYIESEEKGFDCFKTLWWRSFFQEVEMDKDGDMSTCRIHDMMHDLADLVAGENIVRVSNFAALKDIPSKARHVGIFEDDAYDLREEACGDGLGTASKVRTLICFKPLSKEEFEHVFRNFICLRVLVMVDESPNHIDMFALEASTLLYHVDKLRHLRYLGIYCPKRFKLPNSVTNLVNLQVLDLIGWRCLRELPRDIRKLVNLQHLELNTDCLIRMPKGIGELKSLETLSFFVVEKKSSSSNGESVPVGLEELKGLNALHGELAIIYLGNSEYPEETVYVLKEKQHLQSLVLDWSRDHDIDDIVDEVVPTSTRDEHILEMLWPHPNLKKLTIQGGDGYRGVKFPSWLSGLMYLVDFSLENCKQCEYLPPLHRLPSLRKLKITNCPKLKGINVDGGGIGHCDSSPINSTTTTTEKEDDEWPQFHWLTYLCIRDCAMLTRLPNFPIIEGELEWLSASLDPIARTMKMGRGGREGGVDYSDGYVSDATDYPFLPRHSSSPALVRPLSKLTKLTLSFIVDDLESLVDDSFSGLISLQQLTVQECDQAVKLPGSLCCSVNLIEIYLRGCAALEYLPPLHDLSSLKQLSILNCPELKGCWWKKKKRKGNGNNHDGSDDHYYNINPSMEGGEEDEEEDEWPQFPCLSFLEVQDCPKLTQMPLFPTVEGGLLLRRTSSNALLQTMKMKVETTVQQLFAIMTLIRTTTSSSSCSPSPLAKLTKLYLSQIDDLESLPEEGLRSLTSLQKFGTTCCPRLASLPPAMQYITSLQTLSIMECPRLRSRCRKEAGEDWPNISHIPCIELDGEILQGSGWVLC